VDDLVMPPFSEGEKDGQGIGGELLRILFENRRGMAEADDAKDGRDFRRTPELLLLLDVLVLEVQAVLWNRFHLLVAV